jgi:hypothetical protein
MWAAQQQQEAAAAARSSSSSTAPRSYVSTSQLPDKATHPQKTLEKKETRFATKPQPSFLAVGHIFGGGGVKKQKKMWFSVINFSLRVVHD